MFTVFNRYDIKDMILEVLKLYKLILLNFIAFIFLWEVGCGSQWNLSSFPVSFQQVFAVHYFAGEREGGKGVLEPNGTN